MTPGKRAQRIAVVTNATRIIQGQLAQGAQLLEESTQLWTKARHHPTLQHTQWELEQAEDALDQVWPSTPPPSPAQHLAAMH